ncbi:hypothetical protein [Myceligenerans crystallogenes]|uniref:Uncharacterized protein n=1 Tax=Myceligenerans crystallogenes TaxID=316335 RepID=A0ABN2N9L4_9MICO
MEWISALLDTLVKPVLGWLRKAGEFVVHHPWQTVKMAVGAVITGAVVTAAVFAVNFFTAPVRIGGLDVVGFCDHHGFTQSSVESSSCHDDIDLDKACGWTYGTPGLRAEFNGETLYSADCVDRDAASRGGIDNMTGYCHSKHKIAAERKLHVEGVIAGPDTIDEGRWICRADADPTAVCRFNYPGATQARQDPASRQWSCYGPQDPALLG